MGLKNEKVIKDIYLRANECVRIIWEDTNEFPVTVGLTGTQWINLSPHI